MPREIKICDECESEYFSDTSEMAQLCPDCANDLYGYPNCVHQFENGRCLRCYWDGGKHGEYIERGRGANN